jgi:uncharacterized protein YbaR (Trm112 family)
MPLNQELIDLLACPKCKGKLELTPAQGAAAPATATGFVCRACKLLYPIVDDIPNFIIEEARPL